MGDPLKRDAVIAALRGMTEVDRAIAFAEANNSAAHDTHAQIRSTAAKLLGGDTDRATTFAEIARHEALVTDGQVDANKVKAALTQVGLLAPAAQRNWGQGSGTAPAQAPGEAGKAAAAKRYGTPHQPDPLRTAAGSNKGAAGRAEAAKRYGGAILSNSARGKRGFGAEPQTLNEVD